MQLFQSIFLVINYSQNNASRYSHWMVNIFSSQPFYTKYVKQPQSSATSTSYLHKNPRLYLFFKDAIGVIDGSHIHLSAPSSLHTACWNWKGQLSQNCLFCCSFDMVFTYTLTGWEGSASNACVFESALHSSLKISEGIYLLADAGFPHCKVFWNVVSESYSLPLSLVLKFKQKFWLHFVPFTISYTTTVGPMGPENHILVWQFIWDILYLCGWKAIIESSIYERYFVSLQLENHTLVIHLCEIFCIPMVEKSYVISYPCGQKIIP